MILRQVVLPALRPALQLASRWRRHAPQRVRLRSPCRQLAGSRRTLLATYELLQST
jgi:hypothetical protein